MADADRREIDEIIDAVKVLEAALERFATKIGAPMFIPEKEKERFRYPTPSSTILQVLKAIRVVSALNAMVLLLRHGFVQEIGVLLRTVDDFLGEITFLHEAHQSGKPTADQQRFVDLFFAEDTRSLEEILRGQKRSGWVARKKIYAAEARWLSPKDPERVARSLAAIGDVLNRYTHGSYQTIMELYEGGTEKFRVRGMMGTPRIGTFRQQIAQYTHRSLNIFSLVALALGLQDLHERLLETRRAFQKSSVYQRT